MQHTNDVARQRRECRRTLRAFTLVELLVVIGIIGLLIAILVPVLNKARDSSYRVSCLSNLRQLGTAYVAYATQYRGYVPLGYWSGQKQGNFIIHINENGASFYTMMGLPRTACDRFGKWLVIGALINPFYGHRNSRLRHRAGRIPRSTLTTPVKRKRRLYTPREHTLTRTPRHSYNGCLGP